MSDQLLRAELDRVAGRYRALSRGIICFMLWLTLGIAAVAVLCRLRGQEFRTATVVACAVALLTLILTPVLLLWARQARNYLWLARRIEQQHPDLDARLLAALEQHPEKAAGLGYLQQMVIDQAVKHARDKRWAEIIPSSKLGTIRVATWLMFLIFAAIAVAIGGELKNSAGKNHAQSIARAEIPFTIKVEPENASIERGTALLVEARFNSGYLPAGVELLYRDGNNDVQHLAMSKSLDDPLFATRIASVKRDGTYAVSYNGAETPWYKVSVFDYPALKQADAKLKFPDYTGLEEKIVQDTRSVSGVEGTHVTLSFHLNKPVAEARLVPTARRPDLLPVVSPVGPATATAPAAPPPAPVVLTVDPADPTTYTLSLDLKQSQTYQLQLVDADHRANRDRPQMALNVTINRPPELKVLSPNRDLDVSALEEITVKSQVWDDYGVKRAGLTYALVGQPPKDVILAENVPGKEHRDLSQIISLEKLGAAPDQLLSYHLWVEDIGPDGKVRRTDGAMFFADVRPFEEIYRQGEAQAQGQEDQQQRQQQQQQGQQGGQNAQRADQVANTLKQVIAATWNIMRRETAAAPSPQFVPDVTSVESSQTRIREQTAGLGDQVTDDRSQAFLASGLKNMDDALTQLKAAESTPAVKPLPDALAFEQSAYNDLLKLRAREFEVTRSNRQQQQGQQSAAQQRRQQQVNQTDPRNQQNPYQARRTAQQQQQQQTQTAQQSQQETDEQRETRQVLSRLRELAQRQDDLNRQMQDTQAQLQQAQTQEQRDEIQRQLASLRDQQQQQLRDADELRDRMDQPQNQEQMSDARQQLDQTRNNLQQASQNLNNGQMQQAAAAGQRAGEQLNNLQNQMRRAAAGQFGEQMTQMRQDARNLDQQQQQLDQKLANLNQPAQTAPTGLRNTPEQAANQQRQQIAQDLQQQRQNLQTLLDNMQKTIEQSDAPQPLLSRQLYDTYRNTQQQQPDKALDTSRQLVQQGLLQEAQQTNNDASQTVTRLREGVDQAAAGVLGDETAALRRAREQLDDLASQLERETGRAAATQAATRPDAGGGARQLAGTTQPNGRGAQAATQPGGRNAQAGTQPGDRQLAQNDQGQRGGQTAGGGGQPGARGNQQGQADTQPGDRQLAQNDQGQRDGQPGARGGQPGARGDQQGQADTQPGDRQLARNDQGQRGGQPGARGGQPGARGNQQGQAGTQPGDGQLAQNDQGQRGGQAGARGGQPGARGNQQGQAGTQPGDGQLAQNDQGQRGGQPGARGGQPGARGNQQGQAGTQPGDGQLAQNDQGQRGGQPGARGGQPGARGNQQPNGQQPGDQQNGQADQQGGQALARGGGRGGQPGLRPGGQPADGGQPGDAATQPTDGQDQQLAQAGARGNPGLRAPNAQARGGARAQAGDARQPGDQLAATQPGQPNARGGAQLPGRDNNDGGALAGPITGGGYRNFTDNLRDVEEMVNDPRLRDQAATIRQNITQLRQEYLRTSKPPAWNIVQDTINHPLTDLRNAVSQEIARRESAQAAIPLDRDAVPPAYQDQVRTYYERLGSGK